MPWGANVHNALTLNFSPGHPNGGGGGGTHTRSCVRSWHQQVWHKWPDTSLLLFSWIIVLLSPRELLQRSLHPNLKKICKHLGLPEWSENSVTPSPCLIHPAGQFCLREAFNFLWTIKEHWTKLPEKKQEANFTEPVWWCSINSEGNWGFLGDPRHSLCFCVASGSVSR